MTFSHLHDAGEFIVFRDVMARHIDQIARRHWQELSRKIHFTARSNGQKRRQERERREREIND